MKMLSIVLLAFAVCSCTQTGVYEPRYTCPIIIPQGVFDAVLARTEILYSSNPARACREIGMEYTSLVNGCVVSTGDGFTMVIPSHLGERAANDTLVHEVCHIVRRDRGGHEGWIENF